ncbi:unnamed protein product [Closterium sp. Naga37s-1]|nr:unnamed protein product [Closterium sp. Naga37s-1]
MSAGFGDANTTIDEAAATVKESPVSAGSAGSGGSGGINTVNRDAAASASLVQQQQVATASWEAQAELAGLPPDLIRESVQGEGAKRTLPFPERQEEEGLLGNMRALMPDGGRMLEGGMMQEGKTQMGMMQEGMMQEPSFGVSRECTWQEGAWQEGEGSASMQHATAGELTVPGSPCLHSPENASLPASPASPAAAAVGAAVAAAGSAAVSAAAVAAAAAAAAAGAAYPPTGFFSPTATVGWSEGKRGHALTFRQPIGACTRSLFSPTTPGVCCTPAAPSSSCPPAATPGVCRERERGHALTMREPPATWAPLVGLEKVPRWSEVRGMREEDRSVRQAKQEKEAWETEDWRPYPITMFEAEQKPVKASQSSLEDWRPRIFEPEKKPSLQTPQSSPVKASQSSLEDWRPRIRARLDGHAVGLGCIQARSMKERHRRDRIRRGLELLHRALPASLARAQLDTATMVESALTHIKDLQVQIGALENPGGAVIKTTPSFAVEETACGATIGATRVTPESI